MTDHTDPDPFNSTTRDRAFRELLAGERVEALEALLEFIEMHDREAVTGLYEFVETELDDARQLLAGLRGER